ncbi:glycoside hydrolase family 88 protein [Paenibacillus sp. GCM10023252]|uniref:glycoside hydrolase family 88 protein n=1 Tax=Paenibacillus sp. GCM10023252 TaxID=3252649 RepID=UPI003606186D
MYRTVHRVTAPEAALPDGKRVPLGWSARAVVPGGELTILHWHDKDFLMTDHTRLRICTAIDVREDLLVEVVTLGTERVLGTLDIRYAPVFQMLELPLSLNDALEALKEGVGLRMTKGQSALWFLVQSSDTAIREPALLPHLLAQSAQTKLQSFHERMNSLASIQQFGWMEGCVLDGLLDLGYHSAVRSHLDQYITSDGELIYEDPRSCPVDGVFYGIESTLPIAILAKLEPESPLVDRAAQFMLAHTDARGVIQDGDTLSAEGSYTIAYPLAVIAKQRGDRKLAQLAYHQLVHRRDHLWDGDALCLRTRNDGVRTFRNWGRAYAWHLLGLVRCLEVWSDQGLVDSEQLRLIEQEFARTMNAANSYRNRQGLWSCFLDAPETGVDTSASAAIAAAAVIAGRVGLPDYTVGMDLEEVTQALLQYLTPDGFMTGTAQSNKNGEELQRSGYRVISQMAMGLMAQLLAAQDEESTN